MVAKLDREDQFVPFIPNLKLAMDWIGLNDRCWFYHYPMDWLSWLDFDVSLNLQLLRNTTGQSGTNTELLERLWLLFGSKGLTEEGKDRVTYQFDNIRGHKCATVNLKMLRDTSVWQSIWKYSGTPACDSQFENTSWHPRATVNLKILWDTRACDSQFENTSGHPRATVNLKMLRDTCVR